MNCIRIVLGGNRLLKKFALIIVLMVLAINIFSMSALAAEKEDKQVILVLIDKITWEDIAQARAPFIKKLVREGGAGLLSNHTASAVVNTPRAYLTVGSGNRSFSKGNSGFALNSKEKYNRETGDVLFRRYTGFNPGRSEVFYLNLAGLKRANAKVGYTVIPGILGSVLHKYRLKTAVLGNADFDLTQSYQRQAAIIAMDENGVVNYGDVSRKTLSEKVLSPFGLETNYPLLLRKFNRFKDKVSLTVFETGDSRRADRFQKSATTSMYKKYKLAAIARADEFLRKLSSSVEPSKTMVIIASPSPPTDEDGRIKRELTPIIIKGPDFKGGFLTSGSTRRQALVTSTDILPTILDFLALPTPYYINGRPMQSKPTSKNKIDFLRESNQSYIIVKQLMVPIVVTYVVLHIIILLLAVLILSAGSKITKTRFAVISSLLLAILALPLGLIAAPLFQENVSSPVIYLLSILAVVGFVVLGSRLVGGQKFRPLLLISAVTVLFIWINISLFGSASDLKSIFGYSPITAGRFYGLGNQQMSVLVAAALIAASLFMENLKRMTVGAKVATLLFFLVNLFIVGAPELGANTGGIITAVVGFTVASIYYFRGAFHQKQIIIVILGIVIFLSIFIAIDYYLLPVKTHMAGNIVQLVKGGMPKFWQIANRKLSANIRIFKYTSWSYLFLTIVIILSFLRFAKPITRQQEFLKKYKYLSAGLTAGLIAGVVGAISNDSGISITAIILAYFLAVIFYIEIYERYERQNSQDI